MKKVLLLSFATISLVSCGDKQKTSVDLETLKVQGDSITVVTQKALMSNVSNAIKKGGTTYGVEFCNTKALVLTDSLSKKYEATIQRITDKNRNADNELTSANDKVLFSAFKENTQLQDSLIAENGKHIYYKRINLGMETCLKCHGTPDSNIDTETYLKIKEHYPLDKAVGYNLKELRGMWKITFDK